MGTSEPIPTEPSPSRSKNPSTAPPPAVAGEGDEITVISPRQPTSDNAGKALVKPRDLQSLLAGERLDHFELLSFVGGGGMGAVFRAHDTQLNREVAIKILPRDQGHDEENRRRFRNEAQSAARLDHENIARVYFVGQDKGLNYIVFEFIEGLNLRQLVEQRGGPLPISQAISYTWQLAKALDHASRRDVVHRDIKPSNVLITSDGKAKLVDMGLARLHDVEGKNDLTASGVTLGTFDYISPEQARDPRSADVRSDLYSLGCTLYYVLTSRPPFPDGTVLQKLLQHNSDAPPDPREFNDDIPEELAQVVARLLAKNPLKRYQQPAELIGDLHRLSDRLGLALSELGGAPTGLSQLGAGSLWDRHLPWAVPAAALVVVVLFMEYAARWNPPLEISKRAVATPAISAFLPGTAIIDGPPSEPADTSVANMPPVTHPILVTPSGVSTPTVNVLPTTPSTVGTPADPVRTGAVVILREGADLLAFSTLRAACAAAKNGDTIELRFNGVREERPIELKNRRLTIRAAESFQPAIVFRPDDADPLRYSRSMVNVLGGKLTLTNVDLTLDVPLQRDVPSEEWSLIAAQRADLIELKSCILTVRNHLRGGQSQHPDVSFLHVRAAAGFDAMMADDATPADEIPEVLLENCIARGEGVFLKVSDLQAARVIWNNGLLTTTERMVTVMGGQIMSRPDNRLRVELRHLTAIVGQELCKFDHSLQTPYVLETSIEARDCIFKANDLAPLVDQQRVDPADVFHKQLTWTGERNAFVDFDRNVFWRMTDVTNAGQVRQFNFEQWQEHWSSRAELLVAVDPLLWLKLPEAIRPPHDQRSSDFLLADQTTGSSLRNVMTEGNELGMVPALLPVEPVGSSPADGQ